MRFLDVKTDFAFKKVSNSEHSKLLSTSFLNTLLEYGGEHAIINLTVIDPTTQCTKDACVGVKTVLKLLENQSPVENNDDVELIFIEYPKYTLPLAELEGIEGFHDKWLYFYENAKKINYIPSETNAQEDRHDFIRLQRGSIEKALHDGLAKGREEGLKQGIEQGVEQGIRQVASNMLGAGIPLETVMQATGLNRAALDGLV